MSATLCTECKIEVTPQDGRYSFYFSHTTGAGRLLAVDGFAHEECVKDLLGRIKGLSSQEKGVNA